MAADPEKESAPNRSPGAKPDPAHRLKVVGTSVRKVDGLAKCAGQTKFADDIVLPRMLFCKIHRAHVPHAKIKSVDLSRALAVPGVVAILTGKDLPIPFGILPVSEDEHALCPDKVRFVGDPVAAVAALDEDAAFDAMNAIQVEYEPLDPVFSVHEAIGNRSEPLHDYGDEGNIHKKVAMEFGDVERGFSRSDAIFEDTFYYEGNTHLAMEQHAAVAQVDPDGKLTVWSSTQTPHYMHRALSKVLEMPPARVRVIACPNGGGFGGKSDPFNHEIVVAKLALLTGRPVKVTLTREEVFYCHRGRHPVLMHVKTGVTKDGSIAAMHFRSYLDGGAYGSYGVASTYYTGALQTVTYPIANYKFEGARCFTNKPPCGPKRGHGTPQPRFALEAQIDKIAARLGVNPADFRLRHLVPPGSLTANYLKVGSMGLGRCIEKVVESSRFRERHGRLPKGRGIGLACSSYICGAGLPIYWNNMPHTGVQLKLDRGGGVAVFCGEIDIGQGSDTVLAQVVAEVLGIDPLDIRIVFGDTDLTPVDLGSYSSRVTLMMGHAAIQAAERARELLAKAVAAKLEVPVERIVAAASRLFDVSEPSKGVAFAEAVQLAEARFGTIGTVGSYTPPPSAGRYKGAGVGPSPAYSYSAAVVELSVDEESGWIRVDKVHIAHDVGQCINPVLVVGQVEGSVYMGLGEALMEEQVFRANRSGVHKIPSLLEYKSPTTMEMPDVVTHLIEDPDPNGPFGAKEVGQGPLLPIPPAVANAVFDAVGVRIDEVPITPDKVLKALESPQKRHGPTRLPVVGWPDPIRVPTPWEGGTGRAVDTVGGGAAGAGSTRATTSPAPAKEGGSR
jgi:4-hydroxybenzoyl-CoA reductase alpha subunit